MARQARSPQTPGIRVWPALHRAIEELRRCFGPNLHGVLVYGSALQVQRPNDVDLHVVLRRKRDVRADLLALRKLRSAYARLRLDLQLAYLEEIARDHAFSLDAHGAFLVPVLARARILYGRNPYRHVRVSRAAIAASVVRKLQYYVFRFRQAAMGITVRHKDVSARFDQKRLLLAMQDILLMRSGRLVPVRQCPSRFALAFPDAAPPALLERLERGEVGRARAALLWELLLRACLREARGQLRGYGSR